MVPDRSSRLVVLVHVILLDPLRAALGEAGTEEEFRIAIELEVRVSAVHMGDDGHAILLNAILLIAVQAIRPVKAGVDDRSAETGHWHGQRTEAILPLDFKGLVA